MISILSKAATWSPEQPFGEAFSRVFSSRLCSAQLIWTAVIAIAQTPPLQLRVSMVSLGVKDMARSVKFYSETLGLQLVGKPSEVTLVRAGDVAFRQPIAQTGGQQQILLGKVGAVGFSHKPLSPTCVFSQRKKWRILGQAPSTKS